MVAITGCAAGARVGTMRLAGLGLALAAAVCFVNGSRDAGAAETRTYLQVSATVVESFSYRSVHQERTLVVTAADVERGYVVARAASRIELAPAAKCVVEFTLNDPAIRSARVSGPGGVSDIGASARVQPCRVRSGGSVLSFDYRFELAAGTRAGTYPWPVTLTLLPM